MSLQLLTILSPPTPCTPVLRSLCSPQARSRSCRFPFRVGFRSGLHLTPSRVRQCIRPYRVHHFLIWTGHSLPAAPHPVSRRRSCLQLRTASALSDGDFHPTVGAHFQAHEGRPPCRPIFLLLTLLWGSEIIRRTARRPSLPKLK